MITTFRAGRRISATLMVLMAAVALACDGRSERTGPVVPAPVASVEVSPATHSMRVGDAIALAATLRDADGDEVAGRSVAWESDNNQVAAVAADGRLVAVAPGVAHVHAVSEGKRGTSTITVQLVPVASVEVLPVALTLQQGRTQALLAVVKDADGLELPGRAITWSSTNADVAEVTAAGVVTAKSAGSATIEATSEGKTGSAAIDVPLTPVASVTLSEVEMLLETRDSVALRATMKDANGAVLTGRAVTWATSNASIASVDDRGNVIARSRGLAEITATSEGKSAVGVVVVWLRPTADLIYQRSVPDTNQIWTLGLADRDMTPQYVNAGSVSHEPTASPDGARIAFAVHMTELNGGAPVDDIYAVDRIGTNMRRLTTMAGIDRAPAYAPDGSGRIAFVHMALATGRQDIWVMDADGSNQRNLTGNAPLDAVRGDPSWSPDGQWIAFTSTGAEPAPDRGSIWIMRPDGTGKRRLTSSEGFDSQPTWSPDGQRIAFGRAGHITIVTVATGAVNALLLPGVQLAPAWSPDGEHFAFLMRPQDNPFGGFDIWTVHSDGNAPRLRVRAASQLAASVSAPSWIARPAAVAAQSR